MKKELREAKVLLRSIPGLVLSLFVVSVVAMNLLANKSIAIEGTDWIVLDCGVFVSWLSFLSMDIITKRFGPKASITVSIVALLINWIVSAVFLIAGITPGAWGESFNGNADIVNSALNSTISGSWYVLVGSSVAFIVSSVVNSLLNWAIGKAFKKNPDGFLAFGIRTYVSTFIGQFVDNLTFALIVSHFFFGWTMVQCLICSLTGAVIETVFEIAFSPIGYKICKKWKEEGVGDEYLKEFKK